MKELEHIETPEIVIEQQIPNKITFLGSQLKIKGLTMFEFNPLSMTLVPAEYKEVKTVLNKKLHKSWSFIIQTEYTTVHKLIPKEGCVYVQALNKKNAYKKILKAHKRKK